MGNCSFLSWLATVATCLVCSLFESQVYSCIQGILGIGTHLRNWISSVAVTIASMARTAAVCTASGARKFGELMTHLHICYSSLQKLGYPS